MATTTVTLTGNAHDVLDGEFNARRTKVYVKHNTDYVVDPDAGIIRLGSATVTPNDDGSFELVDVIASVDTVDNLQATVYVDYADPMTNTRKTQPFGPYDLSAEVGTVDITALEAVQHLDPSFASETMAAMQALLDDMELISGLTGEDAAVATLITDSGLGPLTNKALNARAGAAWVTGTAYKINQIAVNPSGAVVKANVSHTAAASYSTDTAKWDAVTPVTLGLAPRLKTRPVGQGEIEYHIKDFGAVCDYATDDTVAVQKAIDACAAAGGGTVHVDGLCTVSQIVIKTGVHLTGRGSRTYGGNSLPFPATLFQKSGANVDMVIPEGDGSNYVLTHGISYLTLVGHASSTGRGYATKTAGGTTLKWDDSSFMHHVYVRRFAGDGIWIGGGSPVMNIHDIGALWNGGYGIHLEGAGVTSNDLQFIALHNITGDGNGAGALICIENQGANYSTVLTGIKSEQRVNSDLDPSGAVKQESVVHLKNCASFVVINGLEHISSSLNLVKPGDAIVCSGTNIATVKWSGVKIRDTYTTGSGPQVGTKFVTNKALTSNVATLTVSTAHSLAVGNSVTVDGVDATFDGTFTLTAVTATTLSYAKTASNVASVADTGTVTSSSIVPVLLRDTTSGNTVPLNVIDGSYAGVGAADIRHVDSHGSSRYWFGKAVDHTKPAPAGPEFSVSGLAPMYVLCKTDGATDQKLWGFGAHSGDAFEIRMYGDDGVTGDRPLRIGRTGKTSTTMGFFGVTPVARPSAYTQTYSTATRTNANPTAVAVATTAATQTTPYGYTTQAQADAIVTAINAIIVDLANNKQLSNSVIDDLQALGFAQ